MQLAKDYEQEFMKQIEGRFDPIDQEFAILDRKRLFHNVNLELLIATDLSEASRQPKERQGVVTRSMAKKHVSILEQQPVEEEKKQVQIPTKKQQASPQGRKPRLSAAPLYIGIKAEADKAFKSKLKSLFLESLDKLARDLPDHAPLFKKMTGVCTELLKNLTDSYSVDGYKARPTYHVTSMFLGNEAWKVESEIF